MGEMPHVQVEHKICSVCNLFAKKKHIEVEVI